MPAQNFIDDLKALGYEPEVLSENRIAFSYVVPEGKFKDQTIKLGFEIPTDWNLTPPSGPHISPRLLPIKADAAGHPERVAESPNFGQEWEYWSRPYPNWPNSRRTVKEYMKYIRHLFETQ